MSVLLGSPVAAIQTAMYGRLANDDTLSGMLNTAKYSGVYDEVPEDADYDYIRIGEWTEIPDNALSELGWESTHTLHIWTRAKGHKNGLAILARVCELFNLAPLTVDGFHFVSCRYEFMQTLDDPTPGIRHIPARFRVNTEME